MTDHISATTPDDITAAVHASIDDCREERLRQDARWPATCTPTRGALRTST
jgi:hypothetical protein